MKYNPFVKFLCSIPVILLFIYFIPFLGICLILLRTIVYNNKTTFTSIILVVIASLILIPKGLSYIFTLMKFDNTIPYYDNIINSDLYNIKLINYSKSLFIIGIIYFILSTILKSIFSRLKSKVSNEFRNYISESQRIDAETSQKNDLIMKQKREISKNTHVINCPYCGADNMITERIGTCKFCRKKIEFKK